MEKVNMKWLKLISGIFLVLAGVIAVIMPQAMASVFVWIISVAILLSGISQLFFYLQNGEAKSSGFILIHAILDVLLGILLLLDGTASAGVTLTWCFALWFIFSGISRIGVSFPIKKFGLSTWWLTLINGILGIVVGIFLFVNPQVALLALGTLVGIYMLVYGVVSVCDFLV